MSQNQFNSGKKPTNGNNQQNQIRGQNPQQQTNQRGTQNPNQNQYQGQKGQVKAASREKSKC